MSVNHDFPADLTSQLRLMPELGQIWLGEQRAFLLQLPAFAAFRQRLIRVAGAAQARHLLAHMGFITGATDARRARKLRGLDDVHAFLAGPLFHAMEGITNPQTLHMDVDADGEGFYIEQILDDSIEANTWPAHGPYSSEPACWMQTGHASGFNSTLFGRTIEFREVECRAMGHDHCRIIGKPVEQWSTDHHSAASAPLPGDALVGTDPAFMAVCRQAEKVAGRDVTVLLRGESGVGKERFARLLHQHSSRARGPFVAVNCAAIPDSLIESELFGVEKGAFTGANRSRTGYFEQANGGTLFLDEIGALSTAAQDKLLRVLQEREIQRLGSSHRQRVNIRLLAATNAGLELAVKEGRFREDLFFRINVVPLVIPALRDRPRDIPMLIRHFVGRLGARHQRQICGFTCPALRALLTYDYPGNVRELENIIERGIVLAEDGQRVGIDELMIPDGRLGQHRGRQNVAGDYLNQWLDNHSLDTLVEKAVQRAMVRSDGNISQAARLLGVTRRQLEHRLKKPTVVR